MRRSFQWLRDEIEARRLDRRFIEEIGSAYLVFLASEAFEIAPSDFVHGI
jgi:hypothetical protein